jgi:hypothetical protein
MMGNIATALRKDAGNMLETALCFFSENRLFACGRKPACFVQTSRRRGVAMLRWRCGPT